MLEHDKVVLLKIFHVDCFSCLDHLGMFFNQEVFVARAEVGVCEVVVGITLRYLVYILHSGFLIARELM